MNTEECCNHNCNQGRDCPLRKDESFDRTASHMADEYVSYPAKTLTDEEIKAVYGEYFDIENCDWLHLQCIQAILRKAQEK
jgi:hypothetical protein